MKFSEELAQHYATQHGLSATTVIVWKHRNTIPDSYAQGNRGRTQRRAYCSLEDQRKLMAVLSAPRFTFKGVSDLTGANYNQLNLVKRGLGRLFATDYKAICQYLEYLSFDIELLLANPSDHALLKRILRNEMLILNKQFPINRSVYNQINNWAQGFRKRSYDLPFSMILSELRYLSYFIRTF